MVQDIFAGPNHTHLDKHPGVFIMFRNILGKSFIFARNDEIWKQKRKATSHTFYKDRMEHMLEVLKDKL